MVLVTLRPSSVPSDTELCHDSALVLPFESPQYKRTSAAGEPASVNTAEKVACAVSFPSSYPTPDIVVSPSNTAGVPVAAVPATSANVVPIRISSNSQ